jgi:hypothetical protein
VRAGRTCLLCGARCPMAMQQGQVTTEPYGTRGYCTTRTGGGSRSGVSPWRMSCLVGFAWLWFLPRPSFGVFGVLAQPRKLILIARTHKPRPRRVGQLPSPRPVPRRLT